MVSFAASGFDCGAAVSSLVLRLAYDNGLCLLGLCVLDRRFEVFGTKGAAIIVETFMDGNEVKLSLDAARDGYEEGDQIVNPPPLPEGKNTFDLSAEAFAAGCRGEARPVRTLMQRCTTLLAASPLWQTACSQHCEHNLAATTVIRDCIVISSVCSGLGANQHEWTYVSRANAH